MRKIVTIVCTLLLALTLLACGSRFDGNRTGDDRQFQMDYKILNMTDSQDLDLESGDLIHTEIIVEDGQLAITVQKDKEEPIYQSSDMFESSTFDIVVEEGGTYTVTVTGDKAAGSVSFVAQSQEEAQVDTEVEQ